MATYIDITKIEDVFAKSAIAKSPDSATRALELATDKTNDLANRRQVTTANIPLTEDETELLSPSLRFYCYHYFLHFLYKSLQGSFKNDDIYTREADKEEMRALGLEPDISCSIILQTEVVDNAERGTGIPIL
jgi:hypothetical protein